MQKVAVHQILEKVTLLCLFIGLITVGFKATAQIDNLKFVELRKTEMPILIDGLLDDEAWNHAQQVSDFEQFFPFDSSKATGQTHVKMLFDDRHIYLAARLIDTISQDYLSLSLRRDFQGENADSFTLMLDAFRDRTNAVFFGVNPYNVQREGLISNGGATSDDFDLSWDNIWYSATHIDQGSWSLEMKIPLKTLRYKPEASSWGINFFRIDSKYNEQSVWSGIPRQFQIFNLAFNGELRWSEPPGKPGVNISVIPYTALAVRKNYLEEGNTETELSVGSDVKIAVTPSLNLDLTINPDFSQVEVDQQQTNLDRFEIFFPERRQFFLENADLFSNFGFSNSRPFFSRRIGVAIDSSTGQNVQNRIITGARLSGKIDQNWRIGLLNMQTASEASSNIQGSNFTVAALQRKVFSRSNVGVLFVNQQAPSGQPVDVYNPELGNSNRLLGLEYNLASYNGKWTGKTFYHHTFDGRSSDESFSHGATIRYNTLHFFTTWTHQVVGADYRAKVGFVPRTDFKRINPEIGFNIFPRSKLINSHQFSLSNNWLWNDRWGTTDYNFATNWNIKFQNTSSFTLSLLSNYVKLFTPFNPTGNPDQMFQPGDDFIQTGFLASYQTNMRKPLSSRTQLISGGFFNGSLRQLSGSIDYRNLQYLTVAISYNINKINLTEGFDDTTFFLVGPRLDLTVSNSLFWTTFVQYNTQFDNLNINSRLQWRFRPVSDLFIVYTDNYFPETLAAKSRALVVKFSYWINL